MRNLLVAFIFRIHKVLVFSNSNFVSYTFLAFCSNVLVGWRHKVFTSGIQRILYLVSRGLCSETRGLGWFWMVARGLPVLPIAIRSGCFAVVGRFGSHTFGRFSLWCCAWQQFPGSIAEGIISLMQFGALCIALSSVIRCLALGARSQL